MDWLEMFLFRGGEKEKPNVFVKKIDEIIDLHEHRCSIPILQNKMDEAYSWTNKPGCGKIILDFPNKDKLCEFYTLCLTYDWTGDNDIKEVFAENGFYCAVSFLNENMNNKRELMLGCLNLFLLLCEGENYIKSQIISAVLNAKLENSPVFSKEDFENGVDYIIRQFRFMCATFISPLVKNSPINILSPHDTEIYNKAKKDFVFSSLDPVEILDKANYISKRIESLLRIM